MADSLGNNSYDARDYINTDNKFVRFLTSTFLHDGANAWWLILLFSLISLTAVCFAFLGAMIDYPYLATGTTADERSNAKNASSVPDANEEEWFSRGAKACEKRKRELGYPFSGHAARDYLRSNAS